MENIKIIFDEEKHSSFVLDNDKVVGECEYISKDNKWYIVHTGVREEYKGRGLARLLVDKVVLEARNRNIKIVPICSYASHVMVGNKEYQDVLAD